MDNQDKTKEELQKELTELQREFHFLNAIKDIDTAKRKQLEQELAVALQEITYQNEEKEKRAAELIIANLELKFQSEEKAKRAAELVIANIELVFQNKEKAKRAAELIVANKELSFQNEEKGKRAAELLIALANAEDFENKFRQIAENIDEVFWLRTDSEMIYVSPSFEKIWGIPCQAIYKNPQIFTEKIHPEDKPVVQEKFQSNEFKEHGLFEYEYRIIRADNQVRWINAKTVPIVDDSGQIIKRVGIASDITEKYQTVQELIQAKEHAEKSEKRLLSIIDNTLAGYFFIDNDGIFQNVNQAWIDLYKYESFDEVIGKHFTTVQQINDIENAEIFVEGIKKGNQDFMNGEFSRKCKDGTFGFHSFSARPVYFNNIIIGIEGFIIDTTAHKMVEQALKRSKALLTEAEILAGLGSWDWDVTNDIAYWSDGLFNIFKHNPNNGAPNWEHHSAFYVKEDFERYTNIVDECLKNGTPYQFELRAICLDGEIKHCIARGKAERNSEQKINRMWGTLQDITEQKNFEKELIFAKEKAEESDKLKSAFLSNMSHEIRTPMNGILGFSELLKEPGLTGEKQQEYIRIIEKSGARMLNIINDIVDISRIEANLMNVNIKETDINAKIEFIYIFFKPQVEEKGMQLLFKNTLPKKDATIRTDNEKVYSILTNLVKNAIKYSKEGAIEFGYLKKGEFLEFYVKDTGIGIPKDRQSAIFERFVQADISDKMARQGAGLGLSISKAYVVMLGGKIWVESEEGIGSTFYFTLPYNTAPEEKIVVRKVVQVQDEKNQIKNLKILIAEDDVVSEMLITIDVENFSKEILKARNGLEAIEVCRNNPDTDLILMDIQMPVMNGYEATRQIRQFNKEVVIIAHTAFGLSGDREKAIEAGCNDYIAKPIVKAELLALMQKYFNK